MAIIYKCDVCGSPFEDGHGNHVFVASANCERYEIMRDAYVNACVASDRMIDACDECMKRILAPFNDDASHDPIAETGGEVAE